MDSREGIEARMRSVQGKPMPAPVRQPSGGPPRASKDAAKAAKSKQKTGKRNS